MKPRELLEIKEESEKHSNFLSNLSQAKADNEKEDISTLSHEIDGSKVQDLNAHETKISETDSITAIAKPIESNLKEDVTKNAFLETNSPGTLIQETLEIDVAKNKAEVENEAFDHTCKEMQIDDFESRVEISTIDSVQDDDSKEEIKDEQSIEDLKFDSDYELDGTSDTPNEIFQPKDQCIDDTDKVDLQEDNHENEIEASEINEPKVFIENENTNEFSFSDTEEMKPIADTNQDFFASFGNGNSQDQDNSMQTGTDDWGNFEETGKVDPSGEIDDDFDDFDDFESATNVSTVGANDSYHVLEDILRKVRRFLLDMNLNPINIRLIKTGGSNLHETESLLFISCFVD